jgi:threonine dehydratase
MDLDVFQDANRVIKKIINPTPLQFSQNFSNIYGGKVYLKPENLQKTGSFKIRGAYNCINGLPQVDREKGVIAYSSGNHAQGVAYAAKLFNIDATIVMPIVVPQAKLKATEDYGAKVVLYGKNSEEMQKKVEELQLKYGYTFVHPFKDERVIAGQGTVGLEIIEEIPSIEAVVVAVSGGGLLSGIAAAIKKINDKVKIYGVQPLNSNSMYLSFKNRRICSVDHIDTIADALISKKPEEITLKMCLEFVEDIVLVTEKEIRETSIYVAERAKMIVEPGGVVGLAAVLNHKIPVHKNIVVVLSGGNIDLDFLAEAIKNRI